MSRVIINGVTREQFANKYHYYFDQITAEAREDLQEAKLYKKFTTDLIYTIVFDNLEDKEGTANIIEYLDKQATDGKYFGQAQSSITFPSALDVTIVGDDVGLNKEVTQIEVRDLLTEIRDSLIVFFLSIGWLYNYSNTVTLETNNQLIIKEELIIQEGAEFIIEEGAKLFLEV